MKLDNGALRLISLFEKNGCKAYAVGGCVRDGLLCRPLSDIDIAVSCPPDITEKVLLSDGIRYVETGIKHGTVTAIVDDSTYEITTFRTDGDYADNRRPDTVNYVADIKEDLSRRDFTVNAMAYNPTDGIIDIYGGKEDVKNKIIRAVGDANVRFDEDALRILRALRFASSLGFDIHPDTSQAILAKKHLLDNIARERITAELAKLLIGDGAKRILTDYFEVFCSCIPYFDEILQKHALKNVVTAVVNAPKSYEIRLAVLYYYAFKENNKKSEINASINSLKLKKTSSRLVLFLVKNAKISLSNDRFKIKQLVNRYGFENLGYLIAFKTALGENLDESLEILNDIANKNEPVFISDLAVDGTDIIKLGYHGKEIAEVLKKILYKVMQGTLKNVKEEILKFMSVTVRKSTPDDVDRIMEIYDIARAFMRKNGNMTQWTGGYPDEQIVKGDINSGISYVCETQGSVSAVFVLAFGRDPTYEIIEDGCWPDDLPYAAVHRVASDGTVKGISSAIMDFCKSKSDILRCDTHHDNKPMQRVLEKNRFVRCGIIHLADGSPRIAYQYNK